MRQVTMFYCGANSFFLPTFKARIPICLRESLDITYYGYLVISIHKIFIFMKKIMVFGDVGLQGVSIALIDVDGVSFVPE